ncbi:DUF697 domain-containing protein [Nisaea sp.]|uniref:YcjF family protein n=1 Tax=Nisaea sp. TaxID=2024842 RepID=UPI00329923D9
MPPPEDIEVPEVPENPNNIQDLKREISRLKRQAKAAEREKLDAKKAIDAANAHRRKAENETANLRELQSDREREAKAIQRRNDNSTRAQEKLKKEAADRNRELKRLESSMRALQEQTDRLKKELEIRTEKPGQPDGQAGTNVTRVTEVSSDNREQRIPKNDRGNRKETLAMTAQTDAASAAKNPQTGQPDQTGSTSNAHSAQPDEQHVVKYEQAKTQMRQQERIAANQIVSTYSAIGAGVGIIPIPAVDIAGLAGVQLMMLSKLAAVYKVPFSGNLARALISAVLGAIIPTTLKAGTIGLIRSIPLFGQLLGFAAMPAYSWMVTYAIGTVFADMFEQNQDIGSLSVEETTAKVKKVMDDIKTKEKATAATVQQAA